MKELLHYERSDGLDFLLESIVSHGLKVSIAKNGPEIINMLTDERYNVVLTNGGYEELNPDEHSQIKSSSVFIIGITGQQKHEEGMDSKVDLFCEDPLKRQNFGKPFLRTKQVVDIMTRVQIANIQYTAP